MEQEPLELTDGPTTIRSPTEDDAPAVVAAVQRNLASLAPWLPWAHEGYGIADALAWVRDEIQPGSHSFLVIEEGRPVGSIGINGIDPNGTANLGYWLADDVVGSGHATRATKLLVAHGFASLGVHRIEIVMSVENEPSRRVAERAGATHEGVMRGRLLLHGRHHDAHLYAIVAG